MGAELVAVTLGPDGALLRGAASADAPGVRGRRRSTRPAPATSSPACWSPRSPTTGSRAAGRRRRAAGRGRGGGARDRGLGRDRRAARTRSRWRERPKTTWKPPARAHRAHPRPAARLLRPAAQRAPPRAARRAGADGPLPEHERPQPRRRLHAPARALPRLGAVAAAPVEEVEEAIRPGGISKVKSQRIKAMLGVIEAETGGLDLGFLAERAARAGDRVPRGAARRRAQDGRLRAAVLLRPARSCRSTPTSTASPRGSA